MKKFIRGFGYAFKGVGYAAKTQLNFKVHLILGTIAVITAFILHISAAEWCWVALAIGLVLSAELLNTALEALTDLVSPGYHEKAGVAKDMAAAAVLFTCFFALVTGGIIFIPKILALINHAA